MPLGNSGPMKDVNLIEVLTGIFFVLYFLIDLPINVITGSTPDIIMPAVAGFKKMKTHSDCERSSPIYQQSRFL